MDLISIIVKHDLLLTLGLQNFQKKGEKKQVGWFPASYVKLMEKGKGAEVAAGAGGGGGSDTFLKALYDYTAQNDDELTFAEGASIKLISKEEEVWWKGEVDGKVGVFPSNYVEEVK